MAKMQSATSSSLNAVKDSLQRGQSTIDVGLAAGDTITDLLGKMKEKALAASDTSLNTASFNALKSDFTSLRDQITKAVTNAKFNGVSLVDGTTTKLQFLSNSDGVAYTVSAKTLSLKGLGLTATSTFTTAANGQDDDRHDHQVDDDGDEQAGEPGHQLHRPGHAPDLHG
jgi:flagellin